MRRSESTDRVYTPTSPSLLLLVPCLSPVPNLSSVAYLSHARATPRPAQRPPPPTPRRMGSDARSSESTIRPEERRTSVSAIPRPASGTSRRVTSSTRYSKSCLAGTTLFSPEKARRPSYRRSNGIMSENPPSSFHLPRSILPQSEPLFDESFDSIDDAFRTPTRGYGRGKGLPKSQTTPALLSPNKDIASHGLMRPIEPGIPRSSTYNNVSISYASPIQSTSTRNSSSRYWSTDMGSGSKSRELRTSSKSPCPSRYDGPWRLVDRSSAWTTPDNESSMVETSIKASDESEADPRYVFTYEHHSYWLGRYTALLDRLRTAEHVPPPSNRSNRRATTGTLSTKPRDSMEFDRAEKAMKRDAIKTLRAFCRTKAATTGLERFEAYLYEKDPDFARQGSILPSELARRLQADKHLLSAQPNKSSPKTRHTHRKLSETLPHNIFRKGSSVAARHLSKSTTVASLAQGDNTHQKTHATTRVLSPTPEIPIRSRKRSDQSRLFETRAQAITERDARSMPKPVSHTMTSTIDIPYLVTKGDVNRQRRSTLTLSTASSSRINTSTFPTSHYATPKSGIISADCQSSERSIYTACVSEPSSGASVGSSPPEGHHRQFRKSESMKKLLNAGIREVRKISRRVGTTGGHDGADEFY